MELSLFISYFLVAFIFTTRVNIIALVSFFAMFLVFYIDIKPYMLHALYAVILYPLCFLANDKITKITSFVFIVFQYRMVLDCVYNPFVATELYYQYPYISFSLHLLIILSLINRGLMDGINNTLFTRVNYYFSGLLNRKPYHSHNQTNQGRS